MNPSRPPKQVTVPNNTAVLDGGGHVQIEPRLDYAVCILVPKQAEGEISDITQ